MKKCFDITRLLCLSVLLSVFCVSAALAASPGDAPGLRVALLLEDAAPDRGWNDLLRQGLEQAQKQSLEQGLEQGRTEGEASGRAEREIEIAMALKDRGVSIEIIAETSGLSAEEIDKL